jgi:lipid-A-disaccharide synthase
MNDAPLQLAFVAGEPSGDLHAAHLVEALREQVPGVCAFGFGGRRMAAAGVEVIEDLASEAIMGLFPVIRALPRIRRWFGIAEAMLRERRPDALVLVDYPGFNLRLARRARALGIPVIYYISPQVWAWNTGRVRKIARDVDLMIPILPFEAAFYRDHEVPVFYPGHPVIDHLSQVEIDLALRDRLRRRGSPRIAVFPGSRPHVVESLAPVFADVVDRVRHHPAMKGAHFLVAATDPKIAEKIRHQVAFRGEDVSIEIDRPYEIMRSADFALTTSGTTTMELAAEGLPMVIGYRVSAPFYAIGRAVVKVEHIGLVNLIAGRGIVPEHVGTRGLAEGLARDLLDLATNESRAATMRRELAAVRAELNEPGSYQRTAGAILDFLNENPGP